MTSHSSNGRTADQAVARLIVRVAASWQGLGWAAECLASRAGAAGPRRMTLGRVVAGCRPIARRVLGPVHRHLVRAAQCSVAIVHETGDPL